MKYLKDSSLLRIIGFIIYIIDLIVLKKNKIIFFGSYKDNPKYLFQHIIDNKKHMNILWLSKNDKYLDNINDEYRKYIKIYSSNIRYYFSLLYCVLRYNKLVIRGVNDLWEIRKYIRFFNRTVFNVEHGIAIKKTGLDTPFIKNDKRLYKETKYASNKINHQIVSSGLERYVLSSSFGNELAKYVITGYPRHDMLYNLLNRNINQQKDYLFKKLKINFDVSYIILYAPTHRDLHRLGNKEIAKTKYFPLSDFDKEKLLLFLERYKCLLLIRAHNIDEQYNSDIYHMANIFDSKRVKLCTTDYISDVTEILPVVDILYTDYSGIYIDFLLCNKPIIFIPYDYYTYNDIRGFILNYEIITPGPKVNSFNSLLKNTQYYFNNPQRDSDIRIFIRNLFHDHFDGNCCRRIEKIIL